MALEEAPFKTDTPLKRKKRILVFPCGSEVGLELHRSLSCSTHLELYGASSAADHGEFVYRNYVGGLPYVDEAGFIDAINAIVRRHEIDFLLPALDRVLLAFALHQEQLACPVICSPRETCRICCSKSLTYQTFAGVAPVPAVYPTLSAAPKWPIFLKPDVGSSSRGIHLVGSADEATFFLEKDPTLLAMEYLPGREYTVDCFTDRHGVLRFAGARQRMRISNGISMHSQPVPGAAFRALAETINRTLTFRGLWFFQVKERQDQTLTLMEIAPRAAGTMSVYRNLGVNFPLLSVFDAMGLEVDILIGDFQIEVDRALYSRYRTNLSYRHLYIDLDDCLLFNGGVNTQAIQLLYQCVNRGVALHLLTRHASCPEETLRRFRLAGLFDEIVHLQAREPKSGAIRHRDAVFIDDSYAERKEVHAKTGIAVFAPDAIECLLE